MLSAVARFVSGDLDGSLKVAQAPESPPPDLAAARLAAVSCYAAVAGGLPDAAPRLAALRESWDIHPQVALVAGGCEADHLTWEGEPSDAVTTAERAQTHLDSVAGEGMYGGLWLSALGLGALADQASYCRQRRDDAGAAAALLQGDVLLQRVERIIEGGYGRPGDLGPEGRAWHARAVAEHARLQGEPAVEEWHSPSTPSATGTSTSRRGAAGGWPTRWSPPVIATVPGSTPSKPRPRPSRCRRPRCSGPSPRRSAAPGWPGPRPRPPRC